LTDESSTSVPSTLARVEERTIHIASAVEDIKKSLPQMARQRDLDALEKRYEEAVRLSGLRFDRIEDKQHKTLWGVAAGFATFVGTYIFGKL
jgi:hypothetical protein